MATRHGEAGPMTAVTYIPRIRKEIIINAEREDEIRIAITEDRRLVELFIETPETERHVGDIYLGRLAKVIPGMNAAFVDVGLEQDAFLHFSDVGDSYESSSAFLAGEEAEMRDDDDEEEDYLVEEGATAAEQKIYRPRGGRGGQPSRSNDRGLAQRAEPKPAQVAGQGGNLELRLANQRTAPRTSDALRSRGGKPIPTLLGANVSLEPDQPILVQVTREAFANKGVRVTSRISLPGRFLVLVPFEPGIGISRKVFSVRERTRLRRIVRSLKPRELGVIIRTVAENKEESALKEDLSRLLEQWRELEKKVRELKPPQRVYQDSSLTSSVMRDLFSPDITRIVIDSRKMYREVMDYVEWAAPNLTGTVELYRGSRPILDAFNIESQIEQTLTRKIAMPSGGYLFIEHTEAMVVIDVNSGRYAARREQELNSLKTNLEAAREVARQIRLRDIGGIIVIDFIDMGEEKNRKKVYDEMKKELRKDRAKSSVLPLTEFGLMQITRQRIRQSIVQSLSDTCPVCGGTGLLVNRTTILRQIERWLERFRAASGERKLTLKVHPTLGQMLTNGLVSPMRNLQMKFLMRLKLELDESLTGDEFRFFSGKQKRDVTADYSSTGAEAAAHAAEDAEASELDEVEDEPLMSEEMHDEHHGHDEHEDDFEDPESSGGNDYQRAEQPRSRNARPNRGQRPRSQGRPTRERGEFRNEGSNQAD
ncbi:MAG: Rne/Rng family ribonuclease [Bacteroidota bacterium]|nr:Rne/Rng family ribonuclease [Bacteroidota bacterium]MDP4232223.1 Rne/Rng family ribonuclease [Bacteroidota bacterium]MDP4243597.1 Rne/Rng family ribonuclease [Bacteroidota bacterium]MDP4288752.1 Rne/Rng family ribonuclease [Bacteroidota bacterium]